MDESQYRQTAQFGGAHKFDMPIIQNILDSQDQPGSSRYREHKMLIEDYIGIDPGTEKGTVHIEGVDIPAPGMRPKTESFVFILHKNCGFIPGRI